MPQTLLLPDVDTLCERLAEQIRPHVSPHTVIIGIHTGGVWLAERLHAGLGIAQPVGTIDISFYRDDYSARGLRGTPQRSALPLSLENAHVILVDDVLYTGRTIRAALNEIFDFGRPARVDLAVLIDRGGRELPIAARYCALTLSPDLPETQQLHLERTPDGILNLRLIDA